MNKNLEKNLKKAEEYVEEAEKNRVEMDEKIRQTQSLIQINQDEMEAALNQNDIDEYIAAEARVRFHKKHLRQMLASTTLQKGDRRAAVPLELQNQIAKDMGELVRKATEELSRILADFEKKWEEVEYYQSRLRNCVEIQNHPVDWERIEPVQIVGWFRETVYKNPEGPIAKYAKQREYEFSKAGGVLPGWILIRNQ